MSVTYGPVQVAEGVTFTAHDFDYLRLEEPWQNEYVPIDHRTPLGTLGGMEELLGFARLPVVRKHLGERCYLRDVRNWLRMRNIDGREINWTDLCSLLENDPAEINTPGKGLKAGKPALDHKPKKSPLKYLREARERAAVKWLTETDSPTVRDLAKHLECSPSTASRLKAWGAYLELARRKPKGGYHRRLKDGTFTVEAVTE